MTKLCWKRVMLCPLGLMIGAMSMRSPASWTEWAWREARWHPAVAIAQTPPPPDANPCPSPALSRIVRHRVVAGETLESIAQRYKLIPATLMGFNPAVRDGKVTVGSEILVPPFNGIRVELQPGQTFRDVAKIYNVRPDLLFEVNGCQRNPRVVFVPGVNWSPIAAGRRTPAPTERQIIGGSPLSTSLTQAAVLLGYGWRLHPATGQVAFHGGVDLAAGQNTSVRAIGNGTVAFAGNQGAYGNLIVINHSEGLQTRYAHLATFTVKTGQTVTRGQTIGTVGQSGRPSSLEPHLHLEIRSRSALGWVAEDPERYLMQRQAQQ